MARSVTDVSAEAAWKACVLDFMLLIHGSLVTLCGTLQASIVGTRPET